MQTAILNALIKLAAVAFQAMTPVIRDQLQEFLKKAYYDALATDNPIDDALLGLILEFLGIPRPEPEK